MTSLECVLFCFALVFMQLKSDKKWWAQILWVGAKDFYIHQDLFAAFKERFGCTNKNDASVNSSKIWQNLRKKIKNFHKLKGQVHK